METTAKVSFKEKFYLESTSCWTTLPYALINLLIPWSLKEYESYNELEQAQNAAEKWTESPPIRRARKVTILSRDQSGKISIESFDSIKRSTGWD